MVKSDRLALADHHFSADYTGLAELLAGQISPISCG